MKSFVFCNEFQGGVGKVAANADTHIEFGGLLRIQCLSPLDDG